MQERLTPSERAPIDRTCRRAAHPEARGQGASRPAEARTRGAPLALALLLVLAGCRTEGRPEELDAGPASAPTGAGPDDAGDAGDAGADDAGDDAAVAPPPEKRCPAEMVRVARRFCVDRFEAMLVDAVTGGTLSPYYPPSRKLAKAIEATWDKERLSVGDPEDQAVPLPLLPGWQKTRDFEPRAVAKRGVVPNGYMTGTLAALACKNAGKRLCTLEEWRTACRGDRDLPFPYGDKYVQGKCNVFREGHPAAELHNNASIGHSDPRLNQVKINGKPLLRRTGETDACASAWEGDAIYDMVGNLDEWIDDPEGTFVGGFFSRSKKDGCASTITAHPFDYHDYSLGTRCCADL